MRHAILGLMVLVLAMMVPGRASAMDLKEANGLLEEAHLLFERGESQRAMENYVRVAAEGFPTPQVWTNAGTAAYRAGDVGRAVLYYSRALRQDPSYDRAIQSLRFVQPESNAADSGTEFLRSTVGLISPGIWALISQVGFLMVCFAIARALSRWKSPEARSHWLIVAAWCIVFVAATVGMTFWTHSYRTGGNDAVVLTKGAIARSEPRAESTAQLELPAGTIVSLTEAPARGFVRVKLADGQSGFLSTRDLESI
ncbi:hypothetical protein GC173_03770 [bacterium]|nr:hypothetical protein [bacterium]